MTDVLFYWTGLMAWCAIGCWLARLLLGVSWALIVAVDLTWWTIKVRRVHKAPVPWKSMPRFLLRHWVRFMPPTGETTWHSPYGVWQGFRKGTIYPVAA